ncbi:hypothetical protein ACLBYG_07930 [Methylobacterium sp. D53M]
MTQEAPSEAPKSISQPEKASSAEKAQAPRMEAKSEDHEDWWTTFFSEVKATDVAIAIFTLALVYYTARLNNSTLKLWSVAKQQGEDAKEAIAAARLSAEAAKQSAETARLALLNDQRALLSMDILLTGDPITLNSSVLHMLGIVSVRNVGKVPAKNVSLDCWAITTSSGDYLDKFLARCEQSRKNHAEQISVMPSPLWQTLFPGDYLNPGIANYGFSLSRDELSAAADPNRNQSMINIWLVACVNYTFDTDPSHVHQTRNTRLLLGFEPILLEHEELSIPPGKITMIAGPDLGAGAD